MSEEVSLSIEETNALRKSLGMKPLVLEKSESKGSSTVLPKYVEPVPEKDPTKDQEVDEGKRLLDSLSSGKGILDMLNDPEPETKKIKFADSDSDSSDSDSSDDSSYSMLMSSNKIRLSHDLDELNEGILILKDKSILDDDEDENLVEMESFDLAERERMQDRKQAALRRRSDEPAPVRSDMDLSYGTTVIEQSKRMQEENGLKFVTEDRASYVFPNSVSSYAPSSTLRFQSDFTTEFKPAIAKKKKRKVLEEEPVIEEDVMMEQPKEIYPDDLYSQLSRLRKKKNPIGEDFIEQNLVKEVIDTSESTLTQFFTQLDNKHEEEAVDHIGTMSRDAPPPIEAAYQDIILDQGLASALAFFQSRNEKVLPKEDIHIERRDEFGRSITDDPKLAYKQQSWKFHGVKPKAKKQEKRIRKIENLIKANI